MPLMAPPSLEDLRQNEPAIKVAARRSGLLAAEIAKSSGLPFADCEETARLFVGRLCFNPFECIPADEIRAELRMLSGDGFLPEAAVAALDRLCSLSCSDIATIARELPPYPAAVVQALILSVHPEVSMARLEKVLAGDQVLAGELVKAANSGLVNRGKPAASIRHALVLLGLDTARRLIAAHSLRPLMKSPRLEGLWKHAIDTATLAEQLARSTRSINPLEAFLAGLVHDVGRLVLERLPEQASPVFRRLSDGGGLMLAELVVTGRDHGEIGAQVLDLWNFPGEMSEAVRWHHQPERSPSPLASLLYLAEQRFEDEDEPSGVRVDQAFEWTGLSPDQLRQALQDRPGRLERLLGV